MTHVSSWLRVTRRYTQTYTHTQVWDSLVTGPGRWRRSQRCRGSVPPCLVQIRTRPETENTQIHRGSPLMLTSSSSNTQINISSRWDRWTTAGHRTAAGGCLHPWVSHLQPWINSVTKNNQKKKHKRSFTIELNLIISKCSHEKNTHTQRISVLKQKCWLVLTFNLLPVLSICPHD